MMKIKQDAEYKNIIHKSFKPAYLFSKVLGVMPLSYKRKNPLTVSEVRKRNAHAVELEWSWSSAIYSSLWIAVLVVDRYFIFVTKGKLPLPEFQANIRYGNSNTGNLSYKNDSLYPSHFPDLSHMWLGPMAEILDLSCHVLVIVTGVMGARKIPEIFRQLQHLDENADEDGYMLLGKSRSLF